MKKTLKKLTSLTLVLMLVFSLFSVQASAGLFDKIADVQVNVDEPVTARELDEYITDMEEEYGWEDEEDYQYYVPTDFAVTLSTGEVIETEYGYGLNKNAKRIISTYTYIDIRDYLDAKESGADTLPLYYEIRLLSSILIEMDTIEGEAEIPLIDCYVKSITPVSGIPEAYKDSGFFYKFISDDKYEDNFIVGAVFDVEYPDGTVKRGTVEFKEEEEYHGTVLLDEYIDYWVDTEENLIEIYYGDYTYTSEIEVIDFPITEIAIDDVKVSDAFEAESVDFTVTKTDGTTESFSCDLTQEPDYKLMGALEFYVGGYVDDVPVVVYTEKYEGDEYPVREYIFVSVVADYGIEADTEIEGPEQEATFLGALIFRIRKFIERIFDFLYYL